MLEINDRKHTCIRGLSVSLDVINCYIHFQAQARMGLLDDRSFWRDVTQLGDITLAPDEHDGRSQLLARTIYKSRQLVESMRGLLLFRTAARVREERAEGARGSQRDAPRVI